MWPISLGRVIVDSKSLLRCWLRGMGNFGYDQFDSADIKELMKCRQDKEVYLVLVDDKMVNPCWDLPKIVVVGAGMAGLSAAHALVTSGFTDVTILEASDGPGGRILSYDMRSFPIDLGATHIEGATPMNPLFGLACQEGLLKSPLVASNPYMGTFMTSCGAVLPPAIESGVHYAFENIEKEAQSFFFSKVENSESVQEFFARRIEEECMVFPEHYRGLGNRALYGRLNELRSYWGSDLYEMPVDQYGAFSRVAGCDLRVASGMIGVIGSLIRDLPDFSIRYCKSVKTIKWSTKRKDCAEDAEESKDTETDKKGKQKAKKNKRNKRKNQKTGKCDKDDDVDDECRPATVICSDGSTYPADFVIVTCSLGYLKKHQSTLFSPPLPAPKKNAINRLGWGHLCNIYLLYNEPFWVWKEGLVRLAWSAEELNTKGCWLKGVGSITEVPSSVQMLMVKVGGEEAKEAETMEPERLADDLTRMLRCFVGDPTLPYPFLVLSSKWSSNPYTLGAKSFIAKGSTFGDICALADPIPSCGSDVPVLLFAGEGTSHNHYGTVHGARLSGLREADRIIKITHKFQGKPYEYFAPSCSGYLVPECCAKC